MVVGLGPHFLLTKTFTINDEIYGCTVLKFPQSVLYKDKAGSALISYRDMQNIMTLVFSGFSFIPHLAHHLASLSRSLCRYSTAKSILLLTAHWPASSANCDLLVWW